MIRNTKKQYYHKSIITNVSAEEAFIKISSVSQWRTANFKGSAKNLNDVFTVRFGENKVTLKVMEVVTNKKLVWLVTDCHMVWLKNKPNGIIRKLCLKFQKGKIKPELT